MCSKNWVPCLSSLLCLGCSPSALQSFPGLSAIAPPRIVAANTCKRWSEKSVLDTPHPSFLSPGLLGVEKGGWADDTGWGSCSRVPHVPFLCHCEDLKYLNVWLALSLYLASRIRNQVKDFISSLFPSCKLHGHCTAHVLSCQKFCVLRNLL